jgi:hypothetical protein
MPGKAKERDEPPSELELEAQCDESAPLGGEREAAKASNSIEL